MAMGACLARGNSRIFVLFSPARANFRYLRDGGETHDFFFIIQSEFVSYQDGFLFYDTLINLILNELIKIREQRLSNLITNRYFRMVDLFEIERHSYYREI